MRAKVNTAFLMSGLLVCTAFADVDVWYVDNNGVYAAPNGREYGGVMFTDKVKIGNVQYAGTNLFIATAWPMVIKAEITVMRRLDVTGAKSTGCLSRFLGVDRYVCITPPYEAGAVQTNAQTTSKHNSRYVNAVSGSDDNNGTSSAPFKTLQKAVDAYTSTSNPLVIYVAEGEYNEGGAMGRGVTNRVNIVGARYFYFIATGDRDKTIIRGAAAKNERDSENYPGCGPDAVRCVSFSYNNNNYNHSIAFVGITFADGHTDVGQNADDEMGGGAYGRPINRHDTLQFVDCVFTNCSAPAAGIAAQAHFTRCRFIDCGGATDGFRDSVVTSSIVEDGSFGTGVMGSQTCAIGCSIAGSNAVAAGCEGQIVLNTAAGEGGAFPASAMTFGSTVRSCFADAANGDFRPVSGSPALDATFREYPVPGSSEWNTFASYFSDFASCGFDGKPWIMSGGYPIAGACMDWVGGVSLIFDNPANFTVTGGKAGGNTLSPGDTLTVSRSQSSSRHWGVVANGVTNGLNNGAFVYTYDGTGGMNDGAVWSVCLPTGLCVSFR